jgi:hypothetical protein
MRVSTRNRRTNEEDGKAVGHRILLPICQSCVTSIARLTSAGAGTTRLTSGDVQRSGIQQSASASERIIERHRRHPAALRPVDVSGWITFAVRSHVRATFHLMPPTSTRRSVVSSRR